MATGRLTIVSCLLVVLMAVWRTEAQSPFYCRDLSSANCGNIKPHHCYNIQLRNECCQTCRRWARPARLGCEYGDRSVVWRTEFGKYTCQSYITFFSSFYCLHNSEFQSDCCQSCADALENERQN